MAKLEQLLEGVDPGTAIRFRNLELIPLTRSGGSPAPVEYILASEALEKELLTVTEVDAQGSVPELQAINLADSLLTKEPRKKAFPAIMRRPGPGVLPG